jgi:hypothetical protein
MSNKSGQGWKNASKETIKERIRLKIQKDPNASNEIVRRCIKGSNAALIAEVRAEGGSKVKTPVNPVTKGKTLEQFKKTYDVREKIKDGIKRIGNLIMTDTEFREFCGVHISVWRRYADDDMFSAYRMKHQGIIFWASAKNIPEMKLTVGAI